MCEKWKFLSDVYRAIESLTTIFRYLNFYGLLNCLNNKFNNQKLLNFIFLQ